MSTAAVRTIAGTALPVRGDNIDTDRIIPARFLRSVSFDGLEAHLFADDRAHATTTHPVDDPRYTGASMMIVNANFGCGSSREHAPQAIRRRGIQAVVGESFSEIFFGNAFTLGMPCVSADPEAVAWLLATVEEDPATRCELDLERMRLGVAGREIAVRLPAAAREALLDGTWDATGLLRDRYEEVEAVAARLPYLSGWRPS